MKYPLALGGVAVAFVAGQCYVTHHEDWWLGLLIATASVATALHSRCKGP